MVLNAAAIPFPSEITLPFSGFLASQGSLTLIGVIITAVLGDLVGSVIGYSVGYFLEDSLLLSLIKKYGKFILLTEEDFTKGTAWMKKYGAPFVFVGKITPGVKSFVSVAAGIAHIKFVKFVLGNILGGLVYISLVSYIGFYLGSNWGVLGTYVRKFELVIVVLLVLAIFFYINHKLKLVKLRR